MLDPGRCAVNADNTKEAIRFYVLGHEFYADGGPGRTRTWDQGIMSPTDSLFMYLLVEEA